MNRVAFVIMGLLLVGSAYGNSTFTPPNSMEGIPAKSPDASDQNPSEVKSTVILENEMQLPVEAKVQESKVASAESNLSEEQIPVLKEKERPSEIVPTYSFHKMVVALGIACILAIGFIFTLKKWIQKKGIANKQTHIRVVTQHFLGSKKSLAIVSVAGEYILIGVTDQNISLIKALSLMDDEVPEQPQNFSAALRRADDQPTFIENQRGPDEREDGFSIRNLKEVVRLKLRGMKEIS